MGNVPESTGWRRDSSEALLGLRFQRKSNCSPETKPSDDFDRNKRQNEVLNSLISQMQSLGGVLKIGKVLDAVDDNLQSDIENAQIKSITAIPQYAYKLKLK